MLYMRKKLKEILVYLVTLVIVTTSLTYSASAAQEEYVTKLTGKCIYNKDYHHYTVRSCPMETFIYEDGNGAFVRVQKDEASVLLETYDVNNKLTDAKSVEMELPIFGGFYNGDESYFLVFGKTNQEESNENEVIRVVKYTKNWERVSALSIYGANTYIPFDAGCVRMTETAGKLYLHTSHEMYATSDGLNHQANMTFVIDQKEMSVVDKYYDIMNVSYGYVSHSFNQFIQTDGTYIYRVDHGDAYPRSIVLTKCDADGSITYVYYTNVIPLNNTGEIGANATGASVGGFELSNDNCIIAGNCVDYTKENADAYGNRNIFIAVTDKKLNSTSVKWITNYTEADNTGVSTPQLVKINDDRYIVIWRESTESNVITRSVVINGKGELQSEVNSFDFPLSDCQPVYCKDGMIRWFVSTNEEVHLYCINENGSLGCTDENHIYGDEKNTVPSTCEQEGEIYVRCTRCSLKKIVEKLALAPHKEVVKEGYAPTCTTYGKTNGKYCEVCNCVIEEQSDIPMTEHTYGETQIVKAPTYTEYGECTEVCTGCGASHSWLVDKLSMPTGDINGDGNVTAVDARIVLQIVAGLQSNDSEKIAAADLNTDGALTAVDARIILQKVAGLL